MQANCVFQIFNGSCFIDVPEAEFNSYKKLGHIYASNKKIDGFIGNLVYKGAPSLVAGRILKYKSREVMDDAS